MSEPPRDGPSNPPPQGAAPSSAHAGELQSTYAFFTSDNGFVIDEHRLESKNFPYEESLQVPLLVRGPGLAAGAKRDAMFGIVDLVPTFLDLAGAAAARTIDGRSMVPTLRDGAPGYDRFLIHAAKNGRPWWWRGIKTRFLRTRPC